VQKLICLSQDVRGQVTPRTAAVPTLRSTNYFLELLEEQLSLPGATNYQCSFVDMHDGAVPRQGYNRIWVAGEKGAGPESLAK
jgi:hypothetical protein